AARPKVNLVSSPLGIGARMGTPPRSPFIAAAGFSRASVLVNPEPATASASPVPSWPDSDSFAPLCTGPAQREKDSHAPSGLSRRTCGGIRAMQAGGYSHGSRGGTGAAGPAARRVVDPRARTGGAAPHQ